MFKKRMNEAEWKKVLEGEGVKITIESLPRLIQFLRNGVKNSHEVERTLSDISHSRNWELRGNEIYPRGITP